jgi:hypothetical protein
MVGHKHDFICDCPSAFVIDVVGARDDDAGGDCKGCSIVDVFRLVGLLVFPDSL